MDDFTCFAMHQLLGMGHDTPIRFRQRLMA